MYDILNNWEWEHFSTARILPNVWNTRSTPAEKSSHDSQVSVVPQSVSGPHRFLKYIHRYTSALANIHPCKLRIYLGQEYSKLFILHLIKFFSFIKQFFSHLLVSCRSHSLQDLSSLTSCRCQHKHRISHPVFSAAITHCCVYNATNSILQ